MTHLKNEVDSTSKKTHSRCVSVCSGFWLILFLAQVGLCFQTHGQTWLDEARSQQTRFRIGLGLQALEPSGLVFQVFKGDFCSNGNTYANYGTFEAFAGIENQIFKKSDKSYEDGVWAPGGIQFGVNYMVSLLPTLSSDLISLQLHAGAGIQGGSRKYELEGTTKSATVVGGNLFARFSVTGPGQSWGRRLWFISTFVDLKYHRQFGDSFSYVRPSVGVVLRKAR